MSLTRRFALRFAAAAAAAAALSLGVSLAFHAQRVEAMARAYRAEATELAEAQIRRQGEALLAVFAERIKPALIDEDLPELNRLAQTMRAGSIALELRVYDRRGRPVGTSDSTSPPALLRADAPEAPRGVGAERAIVRWREGSRLLSGQPVCVGSACFGAVAVAVDGAPAEAQAADLAAELRGAEPDLVILAAAAGALCLLIAAPAAAVCGARAGRRLDRSIRAAVDGLERIAAGADGVEIGPRERELSTLALAVERVADAMEAARDGAGAAAALEEMSDGLFIAAVPGRVVAANPALHAMLGREAPALVGEDVRTLFGVGAAEDAESLAAALSQVEDATLADGARLKVVVSARPGRRGDAVEGRVVGVVRDATALAERQAAFEAARERATAAERAKAEFLSVVSHELRTPLNGILGGAAVLAGGDLTPSQRALVDIVQTSGKSLLKTVGDMLNLAKIERGEARVEAAPVDLTALAEEIVAAVTAEAEAKGLELFLHVQPDAPVVLADREKLLDIGAALVGNAVKFTEGGHVAVRIAARATGGRAAISLSVADTGPGVSADKLDSIFESFSQSDSSAARRHGGAGLGLAIVRRLSELLGGRIRVESAPGEGSTFTLAFQAPVDADWAAARQAETAPAASAPGAAPASVREAAPRARRVVLAEANETNRVVLAAFLHKAGFVCHLASNGCEAMKLVREVEPALIVMDSGMPVMTGLEAAKAVRRREAEEGRDPTPIIGLAAGRDGALERCAAAGMDDAVLKPVRLEELRGKIERWMHLGGRAGELERAVS